jgi:hypothetical protein
MLALIARTKDWSAAFPVDAEMADTITYALNAEDPPSLDGADENPWQVITLPFSPDELERVQLEICKP